MAEARGSTSATGVIGTVPLVQPRQQRLQCARQIFVEVGEVERGLAGSALDERLGRALEQRPDSGLDRLQIGQ